ncbi:MAG: MMPL family transporter [Opitutaceae bacterium]|jgi:predicted exporter|nr:MMPL family transporter [Opitutaceae bacterium]
MTPPPQHVFPERIQPWLALAWLIVCAGIAGTLLWLVPRMRVDSNILSLLATSENVEDAAINTACARRLEQQLLWLVKSDDPGPARWWFEQLATLPQIDAPAGPLSPEHQAAWSRHYHRYRAQLLDDNSLQRLRQGPDAWARWTLTQIYSPLAGVTSRELAGDPLLLIRSTQVSALANAPAFHIDQGWLTCTDPADGRPWRLIHATLRGSSFDTSTTHALGDRLAALETEFHQRWPGAHVLRRGALFYSDYASRQAEREISILGAIATSGIILASWLLFRSLRPIILTVLSTAIGLAAGLAGVLLLFGSIHVITLVLATSIIGASEDYAVHYLVERMRHGHEESPAGSLRRLIRVLLLAVLTSAAAYLVLFAAPFPGFHQLATCAVLSLVCALGTVVCWFPLIAGKIPSHNKNALLDRIIHTWLRLWQTRRAIRIGLPAAFAIAGFAGFLVVRTDDDIASLQNFPPTFAQNEKHIATLTGQEADTAWFVVRGTTPEQTLQRLEALAPHLRRARADGHIRSARILPQSLPSIARQRAASETLAAAAPVIIERIRQAGIDAPDPALPPFSPLTPGHWLQTPASEGWRLLWFPGIALGVHAALVPVSGIKPDSGFDPQDLTRLVPGVTWQNRRAEVSHTFSTFRIQLGRLLTGSLAIIALVFMIRFGPRHGIRCLLPLLIASAASLAPLAILGQPFNLFGMFALILVVGIGIDYTLFFSNPECDPHTAMLSVFTAMLSTFIGFGALALSSTPAISSFGLVLATGIAVAFLLAPLARSMTSIPDTTHTRS